MEIALTNLRSTPAAYPAASHCPLHSQIYNPVGVGNIPALFATCCPTMELQNIEEKDEAGTIISTYVSSPNGRIDTIVRMPFSPLIGSSQAYRNMLGLL